MTRLTQVQDLLAEDSIEALKKRLSGGVVLDFKTERSELLPAPLSFSLCRVTYGVRSRFVRLTDTRVLWQGYCQHDGADSRATMEELTANSGALLKSKLGEAAEVCGAGVDAAVRGFLVSGSGSMAAEEEQMVRKVLIFAGFLIALAGGIIAEAQEKKGPLYATMKTSMGDVVLLLFEDKAPKTVGNFVGLATGTKEWTDPKTRERVERPLYNGTIFHRVIPGFMIQGGDPLGNGTGGPGHRFEDEFHPDLKHSKAGILSMANAGPNTNGSQFFITHRATPWLDGRHSVFGEIVKGQVVVDAIANVPRDPRDRPLKDVVVLEVVISRGSY